jgi:hypothetical protein
VYLECGRVEYLVNQITLAVMTYVSSAQQEQWYKCKPGTQKSQTSACSRQLGTLKKSSENSFEWSLFLFLILPLFN